MKFYEGLLEKSIESFKMAIEIYYKPMIQYRIEGFAYYMCNAWELMLKSYMIRQNGKKSIFFQDNPERTLSFENCIQKVFTNNKDPLRLNLEKMLELKNTNPVFVIAEYESLYLPLCQSCLFNYIDKMKRFHDIDLSEQIPAMFFSLSASTKLFDDQQITEYYPYEVAKRALDTKNKLDLISENTNAKFSIRMSESGDLNYAKKKLQEAYESQSYKITAKLCILYIRNHLKKDKVQLLYEGEPAEFNHFHLNNFMKHFGMKTNPAYCYVQYENKQAQYTFSHQAIEFIYRELIKDPKNILDWIKK